MRSTFDIDPPDAPEMKSGGAGGVASTGNWVK
jgi:hypothetical protein